MYIEVHESGLNQGERKQYQYYKESADVCSDKKVKKKICYQSKYLEIYLTKLI